MNAPPDGINKATLASKTTLQAMKDCTNLDGSGSENSHTTSRDVTLMAKGTILAPGVPHLVKFEAYGICKATEKTHELMIYRQYWHD